MPLTWRILLALLCGLGAGLFVASLDPGTSSAIMTIAEPIGAVWLDGLRMTIIPLVFGLVVNGIASASDAASAGAVARKALLLFVLLLTLAGLLAAFATPALLALWPISGDTAAAFAGFAHPAGPPQAIPPASEWVKQIVPANPIAAAAEGAMLPIVIFAVVFGFAATRIAGAARERICGLFNAIVQVMLVIVHWVLLLAPIGVFIADPRTRAISPANRWRAALGVRTLRWRTGTPPSPTARQGAHNGLACIVKNYCEP